MRSRIQTLKDSFKTAKLDGYLVTGETNIFYFTNAVGATRLLVPAEGENVLYVRGVNYAAVKETARSCRVDLVKPGEDVDMKIVMLAKKLKLKSVGYDTLDSSVFLKLEEALKETRLSALNELVWDFRKVKDESELGYIEKAANITSEGIKRAVEVIKPGIREYEVAAEIEYTMRKLGSQGVAFETIVASGPRSAFPHGGCTGKKIQKGELIVLDLGAKYENYRADITRTLFIGKPPEKQARIYETVRKAQQKAFESLGGGVKVKDADGVARSVIREAGYGEYFVHRLGHGIGLDTHEPPTLSSEAEDLLKVGNVVTVEPGIYIGGFGGVRIEDTVRIRKSGAERLTKATYDWSV